MLAELHNKISQSGSNLSDRLEDQLTGDFFGTLRYLPFDMGMGPVLSKVKLQDASAAQAFQNVLNDVKGFNVKFHFWKWLGGNGEIDLLVETPTALIGIEVKYESGISSDDGADFSTNNDLGKSDHQLYRYAEYLQTYAPHKQKFLVFLAKASMEVVVAEDIRARKLLDAFDAVSFGSLTWQSNLETLQEIPIDSLTPGEKLIVTDLESLLIKKGFEQFNGIAVGIPEIEVTRAAFKFNEEQEAEDPVVQKELYYEFQL